MHSTHVSLVAALEELGWPHEAATGLAEGAHTIVYEKDAIVFHAGEPADLLYVPLNGEVKLYYDSKDGNRLLVGIVQSGKPLGVFDVQSDVPGDEEQRQMFTAQTFSRCAVAIVARARIARALRELGSQDVVRLIGRMNQDWAAFSCRFLDLLTMNVRSRLLYTIGTIAHAFGIPDARGKLIRLKLSHEDFGELVGASRPMVSKHLKELATAGIFFKQNGRYILSRADTGIGCADEQGKRPTVLLRPGSRSGRHEPRIHLTARHAHA